MQDQEKRMDFCGYSHKYDEPADKGGKLMLEFPDHSCFLGVKTHGNGAGE